MVDIPSKGRKAIMDGVSRCQATTFKPNPTEKGAESFGKPNRLSYLNLPNNHTVFWCAPHAVAFFDIKGFKEFVKVW